MRCSLNYSLMTKAIRLVLLRLQHLNACRSLVSGCYILLPFVLIVTGCASPAPVPVETLNTRSNGQVVPFGSIAKNERVYTVKRKDTLSEIAWRYNTTVEQIASRNALTSPFLIYPGQKLIIKVSHKKNRSPTKKVMKTPFQHRFKGSGYKSSKTDNKQFQPRGSFSSSNGVIIKFEWPARGEVTKKFQQGRPPSEGIEIAARHGDPVYAAADGVVVYVGEGLRGLGKTVILLHDNQFLTAYSNNRKTRVRYDQSVKQGQIIAEVGGRASETSSLFFQVRSSGRPVDPLSYLTPRD